MIDGTFNPFMASESSSTFQDCYALFHLKCMDNQLAVIYPFALLTFQALTVQVKPIFVLLAIHILFCHLGAPLFSVLQIYFLLSLKMDLFVNFYALIYV